MLRSAMVLAMVLVATHAPRAIADAVVTLRPAAVAVGPVLRLSAVANLGGAEAAGLGPLVLVEDAATGPATVSLEAVRAALEAVGTNLGRVRLRGAASCSVEVRPTPVAAAPLPPAAADAPALPPATASHPPLAAEPVSERLRHAVAAWLGLDPGAHDTLTLTTQADDAALLHRDAGGAVRFRVEPLGRPRLGRVSVRVEERALDGTLTLHTVSVEAEREAIAAVVTGPVRRGDTLSAVNVALQTVVLGREPAGSAEPLATLDGVLGAEAAVTLQPGTRLVPGHLARPALVRRGGHVTVRVAAGAVELVAEGTALADAAMGEAVTVRLSKSRGAGARTVEATVSGTNQVRVSQL